jgi:Rhs element Vgr protein
MSVVTPTILSAGKVMDQTFEVLSIDITKEINRIPYARLILLDGDAAQQNFAISNDPFFEPGKLIEIKLRYEDAPQQEVTAFKGIVVRHGVEADGHRSLLTVELKATAVKLTTTRKSAVFHNQTDDKIMAQIIADNGLQKGKIDPTQPQHAELVQYHCTDWDFILSRAEAQGLVTVIEDERISVTELSLSGSPKHTFEYGLSEIYSFEIEADAHHQVTAVESIAWDIKKQKVTQATKAKEFALAQGNLNGGTIAKAVGVNTNTLSSPVPLDPKELQAWANGRLRQSRLSMLRGRVAVPGIGDLKLLDIINIAGIGNRFNGKTGVTGIRHRIDHHGWQTDIQFGLSAQRFAEQPHITDAPAAGLLPAVHGLQIGIVAPFAEDPQKEYRLKIILPGIDEKKGVVWARLALPDAGKNHGTFFRPEPGDEVVVGFFNDDPRQAVVLGAMYSSQNTPPAEMAKLSAKNINKGLVTKTGTAISFIDDAQSILSIKTPAANTIVLDDKAQTILIGDQHGNAITMSKEGIQIQSVKDVQIDARGNVKIKGSKVDIS